VPGKFPVRMPLFDAWIIEHFLDDLAPEAAIGF
jgi:hypothetical protein